MDSLIGAVGAFWDFLVFPVVLLCMLCLVVYLVVLPGPDWTARTATRLRIERLGGMELGTKLTRFGLEKAVPFIALFTFIFVLNATRSVAGNVGSFLPGEVSYDPGELVLHVGVPEQLSILWQRRPLVHNPRELSQQLADMANMTHSHDSTGLGRNGRWWAREVGTEAMRLSAVKFVMLVALLAYVLVVRIRDGRGKRTRHLIIILAVGSLTSAYLVTQQVYAIEQVGFADVGAMWTSALEADTVARAPRADQLDSIRTYKQNARPWWEFRWGNLAYPGWLYRTFISPTPSGPQSTDSLGKGLVARKPN